jgi:hypothetical protein
MCGDVSLITMNIYALYAMEDTPTRRPELYLIDKPKQFDPFSIVRCGWFFRLAVLLILLVHPITALTTMVATPI